MRAGNDIVYWQHPRCLGKADNARYIQKICTANETAVLHKSENPDLALWIYWSLKEAAYKLSCFRGNRRGFMANRFDVHFTGGEIAVHAEPVMQAVNGGLLPNLAHSFWQIDSEFGNCTGATLVTENWLYSWAVPEISLLSEIYWGFKAEPANDFRADAQHLRLFTLAALQNRYPNTYTAIEKDKDGIPFLNGTGNPYISLTHDHGYLGFAFLP